MNPQTPTEGSIADSPEYEAWRETEGELSDLLCRKRKTI